MLAEARCKLSDSETRVAIAVQEDMGAYKLAKDCRNQKMSSAPSHTSSGRTRSDPR